MATVAVLAAAISACSVSGDPVREPDLSSKAVPSASFPYGPGQPIPATQVPGIIADITFRPFQKPNDPADCTPAAVDTPTAQVRVGPGGPAGGTLTAMVVRATDSFDDFLAQAERCSTFILGGSLATQVTTTVTAPGTAGQVQLERKIRMGPESASTPQSSVTEFVAQHGDIRVYVQNRRSGGADLGTDEMSATQKLFDDAQTSAFGS